MSRRTLMSLVFVAAAAAAPLFALTTTSSANFQYSTGFESPQYTIGNVGNGWTRQDGTPTSSAAPTVTVTGNGNGSAQGLSIINNSPEHQLDDGSVTYVIAPVRTIFGTETNDMVASHNDQVHVQWDMRVNDTPNINNTSDTWALDVYDSTGETRAASFARSAISSQPGGAVTATGLYATDGSGEYNPSALASFANDSGAWNTYAMDLNYLTRTFTVSFDGQQLGGDRSFNSAADNGFDVNFTVNGRGLDSADFDNFSVTATPEPASLGLLGLMCGALLGRRHRRA
jgi:PEP-CTERM motif